MKINSFNIKITLVRVHQFIAVLLCVALLQACSSTNVVNIEGKDGTGFYNLQTTFPVSDKDDAYLIKLRAMTTEGEFANTIPDGKIIDFEDIQIVGPDEITGDMRITTGSVSFGVLDDLMADKFFMSAFAGVATTRFKGNFQTQSGINSEIENNTFEVYVDLKVMRELTEKINAGVSAAFGRNLDLSGTSAVDILINFETGRHMEIEAGYRWFTYDYLSEENDSGVEIDLNGPFIAVNFPL